jgi:hypothetical protein
MITACARPRNRKTFSTMAWFGDNTDASLSRRFLFAFFGLLEGDAALLLWLLPGVRDAGVLILYGIFSFVGWALIGLPFALAVSPRFLCRLYWAPRLLIGASLGPLALLAIFVMLEQERL